MSQPTYEIALAVHFDEPLPEALYPSSLDALARAFEGDASLVVPRSGSDPAARGLVFLESE